MELNDIDLILLKTKIWYKQVMKKPENKIYIYT